MWGERMASRITPKYQTLLFLDHPELILALGPLPLLFLLPGTFFSRTLQWLLRIIWFQFNCPLIN